MNNNTSKNKKDIKLNDLNKIIQDLMDKNKELIHKNKEYEKNFKLINHRLFGKYDELMSFTEDVTYGNVSDEVQRLSTIVKNLLYNKEQDYYNNSTGSRWGEDGYIEKIEKRVKKLKKKTKNSNEPPSWQSNY